MQAFAGMLLYLVSFAALYPYCQYYLDPDATAYMIIIRRYVQGDYITATNGLWNPLHAWVSALLIRISNVSEYQSALYTNAAFSVITLWLCIYLCHRFISHRFYQWLFSLFFPVYWAYGSYFQLTSDIFGAGFGLMALLVIIRHRFYLKWYNNLLLGLFLALAGLAKTYMIYIFVLFLLLYFGYGFFRKRIKAAHAFRSLLVMGMTTLILISPYIYMMHEKYGVWHVSLAGKFNQELRLMGTNVLLDSMTVYQPPVHENSLSFWEDPYVHQGKWHSMFDSPKLFGRYILRLGFNFTEWSDSINHYSFFYGSTWFVSVLALLSVKTRRKIAFPGLMLTVFWIIFPVGLYLVHIETRYLWVTLPLSMITSMICIQALLDGFQISRKIQMFSISFFFVTFLSGIAIDVRSMINNGKEEYLQAQQLKKLGIHGSFVTSNSSIQGWNARYLRLSYFADCPIYNMRNSDFTMAERLKDAKRYQVDYYFYFFDGIDSDYELKDTDGIPFRELTNSSVKGLKVFSLKEKVVPAAPPDEKSTKPALFNEQ